MQMVEVVTPKMILKKKVKREKHEDENAREKKVGVALVFEQHSLIICDKKLQCDNFKCNRIYIFFYSKDDRTCYLCMQSIVFSEK